MSSTECTDMQRVVKEFLSRLHYLSILTKEVEYGYSNALRLYTSVYELGRRLSAHPDYRQMLTDEDKTTFKQYFPTGFVKLVDYTPGLVGNIEPSDLNIARTRRSQIWFLKNELLDLYKEINGKELTTEMQSALDKLQTSDNMLDSDISDWIRPDYDEAVDKSEDVPNLNGVPPSHDWWTEEHRRIWENSKE
ncbi:unnamed protein product [Adineta ricciae]|uniref:Uncharacterized protein n=1 Tax=Adineta ricciae TaxID=249248 RepID=A0A815V2V1_ADIRI|nr:unnamed protein product [Adineta ricciae]CAF1524496.1 unnamed protein product [Adineta ricciae]